MVTKIKLLLGVVLGVQNATVVELKFFGWSHHMSQALVIFLTGAVGATVGFLFGTVFKVSRQT